MCDLVSIGNDRLYNLLRSVELYSKQTLPRGIENVVRRVCRTDKKYVSKLMGLKNIELTTSPKLKKIV